MAIASSKVKPNPPSSSGFAPGSVERGGAAGDTPHAGRGWPRVSSPQIADDECLIDEKLSSPFGSLAGER